MVQEFLQPIIILGSPRSGTSLVASIFAAHGVFVGTSRPRDSANPRGYYENVALTDLRYSMGHGEGLDPKVVYDCLLVDGYNGGPWLVKHSPLTWRVWRNFKPYWIFVRRAQERIISSRIRCGQWDMNEVEHRIAVETDIAIINAIQQYIGGSSIWSDVLVSGHFETIRHIFDNYNLEFDNNKTISCIDPALWHYS